MIEEILKLETHRYRLLVFLAIIIFSTVTFSTVAAQPSAFQNIGVDSSKTAIDIERVLSGGPPPNGIPALGFGGDWKNAAVATAAANFISQQAASEWLNDREPVLVVSLNKETKAYPMQILMWHEIVNDTLADIPIAVTFCPLCNSGLAFDRRLPLTAAARANVEALNPDAAFNDVTTDVLELYQQQGGIEELVGMLEVTFGTSGMLYNSNLLMFDSHTSTLWSQLGGDGNVGTLTGTKLLRYSAQVMSFADFKNAYSGALVLSRETGFERSYGENPYLGYDVAGEPAFLFDGEVDGRLPPKTRVVTLEHNGEATAYPFDILQEKQVINDTLRDKPITVFWQAGTASALDKQVIADSQDVGSVGVFSREVNGQTLTFSWKDDAFIDEETKSTWNLAGEAVAGSLKGTNLGLRGQPSNLTQKFLHPRTFSPRT
jgi:Protein of unknown function (DUF3179)